MHLPTSVKLLPLVKTAALKQHSDGGLGAKRKDPVALGCLSELPGQHESQAVLDSKWNLPVRPLDPF